MGKFLAGLATGLLVYYVLTHPAAQAKLTALFGSAWTWLHGKLTHASAARPS
jgi:hypothetical protein